MKTGFVNAFVNIMKPISYPYHGIISPCYTATEIPPYIGPDMKPVGEEWIIEFEGNIGTPWRQSLFFYPHNFLKSSDNYLCPDGLGTKKNVYYFTEVYLYQRAENEKMGITWSDGINCKFSFIYTDYYLYIYKAWFNLWWQKAGPIWWVFNTGPSSFGRIWKSLTGEYPGYLPFPQKQIIRV